MFLRQRMGFPHQESDGVGERQLKGIVFPEIVGLKQQAEVQQAFIQTDRDIVRVAAEQRETNAGMFLLYGRLPDEYPDSEILFPVQ